MFRLLAASLLLLVAGCAGPAVLPQAGTEESPPWRVTATRVEPHSNELAWQDELAAHPCATDGSEVCRGSIMALPGLAVGISWDEPTRTFRDEQALFWRVDAEVSWRSSNPLVQNLEFEVRAIQDCDDCEQRVVEAFRGESPLLITKYDVFLEPGEVGVRLIVRATPEALMETAWGAAALSFRVDGTVAGFRPVAPPVVVSDQAS